MYVMEDIIILKGKESKLTLYREKLYYHITSSALYEKYKFIVLS